MTLYNKLINRNDVSDMDKKYAGISGWLMVPAVSMCTTPLMLILFILSNFQMINDSFMNEIVAQYPGFKAAMISQTIIAVMQLVLVIYVAMLFFRRKQSLPSMIIAFLTIHLLIIIANLSWIFSVFKEINYSEYTGVTAAIIMVAFGIPYFVKSKRVRATFVNP